MISNILNENTQSITSTGTFIYGSENFILPPDPSLGLSYQLVKENDSASTITNKDGDKYIIFKQTHPITKWTIVEYFEVNSFYKPIIETKIITFLIIFLITLICFFAALFISLKISGPIKRLQKKILEVENGNLEQKFITNSKDEIGALARGFNHMLFQIKKLIESVAKEEKLKKEAEITALQLQINPHFIYNTLETINSLARKKKEYEISHLIVLLGRLLRLSISSFEEKVTINQEITYIDYYLKIQKARLKEPLEYYITIDPEIQDCMMIKWILQPIVENAIIHGIDPLHSGGKIYINGTSTNDSILFTIIDNGKGIDPITLAQIQEKLKYNSATLTKYKKRVGIYNVQTRIVAHHGEKYGISIDSKVDEGTSVTIKIPKLEGDQV
nr:histidine kinase [Bacillus sp. FJAT-50079]